MKDQWIRKIGLFVHNDSISLDLSQFHIRFNVFAADTESPNNATIRVYNPSQETINQIVGKLFNATLNAGYENGNYGVIFTGTIRQFRKGRESATTSYLDILAADGDLIYTGGVIATTIAKGTSSKVIAETISKEMKANGVDLSLLKTDGQHVLSIRGKVLFGMGRYRMRELAQTMDSSWTIQDGKIVITDYAGYRENEIVELNSGTGLIGFPEQTDEGIKIQCLLNPRLRIGSGIKITNSDINQTIQSSPLSAPVAYNSYGNIYNLAPLTDESSDGIYRIFVLEYSGDTRGQEWYCDIVALAVNPTKPAAEAVNG